jgi:predicted negative regulator of RcsB-dependent stress response
VARITRRQLKSDKFAEEVGLTVDFFEEHRQEIIRYGGAALALAALVAGYLYYARHQRALRQDALFLAMQTFDAPVGQASEDSPGGFPTEQAKDEEATRRFTALRVDYPRSDEARIAGYYLGCILGSQGKYAEAEKAFLEVASGGDERYASLAKLALAQIYFADGRASLGEKTLRDLMDRPTVFVTKDQAAIALARLLMTSKPAEARKLLQPLLGRPGGIGQVAASLNTEIPE